jgi:hypothetical protein
MGRVDMIQDAKHFGPHTVTSYQWVMGMCAFANAPMLLAATMGFPSRISGGLQLLFICGLPVIILLYRFFPLIGVVYGMLPLVYVILGKWIALPLFFKGISVSIPFVNWAFAITAIAGYLWHLGDRREIARQAEENARSAISQR